MCLLLAQMDRVSDSDSDGRGFESHRVGINMRCSCSAFFTGIGSD